ncbi:MAG: NAD-dependent epimerase/dehydratase family protein [Nocardioides sp.]|nr:NAD-dependent epimerase/dehydratase family protein [Nocardioides sp.]
MNPDVLLIGCGDLGSRIGVRLTEQGHTVLGVRRNADRVPAPLRGLSADLTKAAPQLPPLDLRYLVVALTARPRTEDAYRATYVHGMGRALDALDSAGQAPDRAVLVSSTAVYGDVPDGVLIDEGQRARPTDGPGRMLLEAEELFASRIRRATVLRCSGLYGGRSARLVEKVRSGQVGDPDRWTNRIHRDDAAAAVVHLLTQVGSPQSLYIGSDDEPALMGDVAGHLAAQLGVPAPPPGDLSRAHGKRLSNARLRASGWVPTYATHREGM